MNICSLFPFSRFLPFTAGRHPFGRLPSCFLLLFPFLTRNRCTTTILDCQKTKNTFLDLHTPVKPSSLRHQTPPNILVYRQPSYLRHPPPCVEKTEKPYHSRYVHRWNRLSYATKPYQPLLSSDHHNYLGHAPTFRRIIKNPLVFPF